MKRSPAAEVIYRRSGTVQSKLVCNHCKAELPHARKLTNIRSVHLTCSKCGHTITVSSENKI